jgi:tetratricopeptide (TPR) repeat protein
MGFVWHIEAVDKLSDNNWKVSLQLSTDMDSDLTKSFNEWKNQCTFFTLGKILHELGEYKRAIGFYDRMLDLTFQLSEKKTLADIHFHIAISAFEDGSYSQALHHLKEAECLIDELITSGNSESTELQPILAEDVSISSMCILMNKCLVYRKRRDYKCAEQSFNKAHLHYHFGVLQFERGYYENARNHFSNAFDLASDQVLKNTTYQRLDTLNKISSVR